MNAYFDYLNELITKNKSTYSNFDGLKWLNPYSASEFQEIRDNLLSKIGDSALFKKTKPYYNHISKGCELCGQGKWSCLFITNKCNASCFYCPAEQSDDSVPVSQGLSFPTPESYAEYIKHFGFKGVSFSGGEPLLFPERLLAYLKAVRKSAPSDVHIWMYTNGIKANDEIFRKLADTGLDEVRFDIGATAYKLDKIKHAKGKIKNLTIEIPAVPEEKNKLIQLLPEMIDAGVTNLNLHQLRLTNYNTPKLFKHDYTYIPAEKPIVLESELAALEIMAFAKSHNLEIGVNYCSFLFKNRFQSAGFRKTIAKALNENPENITEKGYVRSIKENKICYQTNILTDVDDLPCSSTSIKLKEKEYFNCKQTVHCEEIDEKIEKLIEEEPAEIPENPVLFKIWKYEYIEKGLREY